MAYIYFKEAIKFGLVLQGKEWCLMNENNIDMSKLMQMLSKMDKSQLEKGLNQVQQMLNNNNNNNNKK